MNVIRPVVQLHTLDQWLSVGTGIQDMVLGNIKLAARLDRYLMSLNGTQKKAFDSAEWVPCSHCKTKGHILVEPRYAGIHPSQVGTSCLLRIYNDAIGLDKQEKIDPRLRRIFDLGHNLHHMFQSYGERGAWGPSYAKEVDISSGPLADDLLLEGKADADNILVIDDIDSAPIYEVGIVHEYKSINEGQFLKLTRPKPEHKMQATLYMMSLNRPIVVYLYFNKNDSNILDYPVGYDPSLWANLYSKTKTVAEYVRRYNGAMEANEPLPPGPKGSPGYDCNQCGYAKSCPAYKSYMDNRNKPKTGGP